MNFRHRISRGELIDIRTLIPAITVLTVLSLTVLMSGCGSSSSGDSGSSTKSSMETSGLSRPNPGTVQMIDSMSDVTSQNSDLAAAPSFLDINWTSVSKEGNNFKFTMEVNGMLPLVSEAGSAVEWGFLLDVDQDGKPDWGVFTAVDTKNGLVNGLSDLKTNEKRLGAQFPGTLSYAGTTLVWTVDMAAIGSPQALKWFTFSNYYTKGSDGQPRKASDQQPEAASNSDSNNWLPYP